MHRVILPAIVILTLLPCASTAQLIATRLLPSFKNAGFRMEGFLVWGGSIVKADDSPSTARTSQAIS